MILFWKGNMHEPLKGLTISEHLIFQAHDYVLKGSQLKPTPLTAVVSLQLWCRVDRHFAERAVEQASSFLLLRFRICLRLWLGVRLWGRVEFWRPLVPSSSWGSLLGCGRPGVGDHWWGHTHLRWCGYGSQGLRQSEHRGRWWRHCSSGAICNQSHGFLDILLTRLFSSWLKNQDAGCRLCYCTND